MGNLGGYVYVATNSAMPNLVKIGMTENDPTKRIAALSSPTGVPTPFDLKYYAFCSDRFKGEKFAHRYLAGKRVNNNREFFEANVEEAAEAIIRSGLVETSWSKEKWLRHREIEIQKVRHEKQESMQADQRRLQDLRESQRKMDKEQRSLLLRMEANTKAIRYGDEYYGWRASAFVWSICIWVISQTLLVYLVGPDNPHAISDLHLYTLIPPALTVLGIWSLYRNSAKTKVTNATRGDIERLEEIKNEINWINRKMEAISAVIPSEYGNSNYSRLENIAKLRRLKERREIVIASFDNRRKQIKNRRKRDKAEYSELQKSIDLDWSRYKSKERRRKIRWAVAGMIIFTAYLSMMDLGIWPFPEQSDHYSDGRWKGSILYRLGMSLMLGTLCGAIAGWGWSNLLFESKHLQAATKAVSPKIDRMEALKKLDAQLELEFNDSGEEMERRLSTIK